MVIEKKYGINNWIDMLDMMINKSLLRKQSFKLKQINKHLI